MKQIFAGLLLIPILLVPALAESDPVMGIWEGSYTSETGDSGPLVFKVIAL